MARVYLAGTYTAAASFQHVKVHYMAVRHAVQKLERCEKNECSPVRTGPTYPSNTYTVRRGRGGHL